MSPRVDLVERRYLGALLFVDGVTRTPILDPLVVQGLDEDGRELPLEPSILFLRNRRNRYAIVSAAGLEAHGLPDEPDQTPDGVREERPALDPGAEPIRFVCRVLDPRRRYVPIRFTVELPRDPDPGTPTFVGSLFQPQVVHLYPAPNAPIAPNWAAVRVLVTISDDGQRGAPYALLRLLHEGSNELLGTGLTDHRGEGLLAVADLPAQEWGATVDAPVESNEIPCVLQARYDPTTNDQPLDLDALEVLLDPSQGLMLPDPVELEITGGVFHEGSTSPGDLALSPGRIDRMNLTVDPP